MLPSLVEDVGDAGGGNAGTANGKAVSKVVVVKLNAGAAFLIGYHVRIPVQGATRINVALNGTVRVLGSVKLHGLGETFNGGGPVAKICNFPVKEHLVGLFYLNVHKVKPFPAVQHPPEPKGIDSFIIVFNLQWNQIQKVIRILGLIVYYYALDIDHVYFHGIGIW